MGDPKFDEIKTHVNGKLFTLEAKDLNGDGIVDIEDLQWRYLEGDGDFRSDEITQLRDEADIVITNPPFSLFRQFIVWLMVGGVKFSMIGNQNAITYKEVFPPIKANQIWLGKGFPRNMAHFNTPYAPQSKWIEQKGNDVVRVPGVQWFTNIEHGRRHEPMQLMTMADNLKFNKKLIKWLDGKSEYQRYDNYDAIEIPFTDAIPSDYDGVMGVPVTWLAKYDPDQFEILFSADDMAQTEAAGVQPLGQGRVDDYYAAGGTGGNSKGHRKFFLYHPKPWVPYKRIAIRHRRHAS